MGEIKSTLELALERTKHLTLSENEKKDQRLNEAKNFFKGLIQKYKDSILTLTEFEKEFEKLQNKEPIGNNDKIDKKIFLKQVLDIIHIDTDNTELFDLLDSNFDNNIGNKLNSICGDFNYEVEKAIEKRQKQLKTFFLDNYDISGSSVIPNVYEDETFQKENKELINKYSKKLDNKKNSLMK